KPYCRCPADVAAAVPRRVQDAALGAFRVVGGRDYARVDVMVRAKALRSLGHAVTELDPKDGTFTLPRATDVVFLALHGTYGEDGTVQAQLEKLGVPYTGCDAEASRIAFDKVLTKERCVAAGIPTAKFIVIES